MALSIIKPASIAYMQTLINTKNINLELKELILVENSSLINTALKDSGIRENFGTLLLALKRDNNTILNPSPDEVLLPGDIMILCGPDEKLSDLESFVMG